MGFYLHHVSSLQNVHLFLLVCSDPSDPDTSDNILDIQVRIRSLWFCSQLLLPVYILCTYRCRNCHFGIIIAKNLGRIYCHFFKFGSLLFPDTLWPEVCIKWNPSFINVISNKPLPQPEVSSTRPSIWMKQHPSFINIISNTLLHNHITVLISDNQKRIV